MAQPLTIGIEEMCAQLGVSKVTLWRIRHNDPSFPREVVLGGKRSRQLLYDREHFNAWYRSQIGTKQLG